MKNIEEIKKLIQYDPSLIDVDLSEYYELANKTYQSSTGAIEKFGTIEDYVNILYWMRFVKHFDNSEITQITDDRYLAHNYVFLGWNYGTFDFDECLRLKKENEERLLKIKDSFDFDNPVFSEKEYIEKVQNVTPSIKPSQVNTYLMHYDCKSIEELRRKIYYYQNCCELSTYDIGFIFDKSYRAIQRLLIKLGQRMERKEAMQRAAKHRDYTKLELTRRKTVLRTIQTDGVFGSHTENLSRTILETVLSQTLNAKNYEIIVGLNTRSIVPPQEVDIPIIIINKKTKEIWKIAVEIEGAFWHQKEVQHLLDEEKAPQLNSQGWTLFKMRFYSNDTYNSKSFNELIYERARLLVNEIENLVKTKNN